MFRQIGHGERAGYGLALAYGGSLLTGPHGYADEATNSRLTNST